MLLAMRTLAILLLVAAAACGVAHQSRSPEQWTAELATLRPWRPGDGGSFFGTAQQWRHPDDAHDALVAWGAQAVPPLVQLLRDPQATPDQKLAALEVLGDLGPAAAVAAPEVAACAALGATGEGAAASTLRWFWATVTNDTLARIGRADLRVPVPAVADGAPRR